MSEDRELAIVQRLLEATRSGKVQWERFRDPGALAFLAVLPTGSTFLLQQPMPTELREVLPNMPPGPGVSGAPVSLEVRDRGDRRRAMVYADFWPDPGRIAGPKDGALLELFALVKEKVGEPLDEILAEIEHAVS